jgi:flagellar protein FlgJ
MSGATGTPSATTRLDAPAARDPRAELRRLSDQLQAVFLNQLFQAMRASVPETDGSGADPGREMFTQMLDERLSTEASKHMHHGISDALYRQLSARLAASDPTEAK